jgi:hypothetical protein
LLEGYIKDASVRKLFYALSGLLVFSQHGGTKDPDFAKKL